jgi:dethiobiotin synthetase
MSGFFVTGIGTGIGKTTISAMLVEALKADYWKPIQCGSMDFTDTAFIREFTLNRGTIHTEEYLLAAPKAPYMAAKDENRAVDFQHIKLPKSSNPIIVEGAGGILVPVTEHHTIKDLAVKLALPVILVSMNYLGSINHTLLTVEYLRQQKLEIAGIVFNGDPNPETENYILNQTRLRLLAKIPKADLISKGFIIQQSEQFRKTVLPLLSLQPEAPVSDLPIDYESF